ncbi:MAG: proton-conducting transporter membrane subunit [Hyphomonadaceae bacterium]
MSVASLFLIAFGAPLLRAALSAFLPRPPGLRDALNVLLALAQAGACVALAFAAARGADATIVLARPLPDVAFALALEPLGAAAAAALSVLGALHALHTAAWLRAARDPTPGRMQAFIALCAFMTMGVAFSANLFALFVFYQGLTLASAPLIAHAGDERARRAARLHLSMLLGASIALLLPAIVWTYALAGDVTFRAGGVLAGHATPIIADVLLALFVFGFAKAALPPVHRWLPEGSQASFPAIATVQALAVLPAGAIGILKTTLYVFGPAMSEAQTAARLLLALAGATMCVAALNALGKSDIRARMAYAMVAQNAAVIAGAMLAAPPSYFAAILQLIAQSAGALTLIMAFANVEAATGRLTVNTFTGLGRVMPWTFAAVAIGAAGIIGLPPLAGAWPRLWLMTASAEGHAIWAGGLAALGAIAAFACFAPLAAKALVGAAPEDPFRRPDGASIGLVAPVVLTAAATASLIFVVDPLAQFLAQLWGAP